MDRRERAAEGLALRAIATAVRERHGMASRCTTEPHMNWLTDRFTRHRGRCVQDLAHGFGVMVSLRTIERAAAPLRQSLAAAARAGLRCRQRGAPDAVQVVDHLLRNLASPCGIHGSGGR